MPISAGSQDHFSKLPSISDYFTAPSCEVRWKIGNYVSNYGSTLPTSVPTSVDIYIATRYGGECNIKMSELEAFMKQLSEKLDSDTVNEIKQTVKVNGFTTRLQIKLISEKDLVTMFQSSAAVTMGAKNLLWYHIELLRDESPLVLKPKKKI